MSYSQEKQLKKANENFEKFAFIDAQKAYLKVAEDGYLSQDLLMRLADSYYFVADYDNAALWYGKLYDFSENLNADYLYRYAQSLKSLKQYALSDTIMEEFYQKQGNDARASLFAGERNYLAEIEAQSGRFELKNVSFNSKYSDFAPAFKNGNIVFASNRLMGNNTLSRIHDWNEQPFLDLFEMPEGQEDSYYLKPLKGLNTKFHESTAVFTKDGNTVFFTRNNYTKGDYKEDSNGTNRLKLYRGIQQDGKWQVTEVPFNSDEYSVAHPALSNDEKTLYFASDMPGSKGMSDLYKVQLTNDGYGTPVSLGDDINTEGRETFPFVSQDGTFYFASDGHPGLGGLDIFVAEMNETGFGAIFNVGKPVNSAQDDFTFVINSRTKTGYFASNREGGNGDDDIYSFVMTNTLITKCSQNITGVVLDEKTEQPIANAMVTLLDSNNNKVSEMQADANGAFNFMLDCNKQYSIRAIKEGFSTAEKPFASTNELGLTLNRTLYLRKGRDLTSPVAAGVGTDLNTILSLNPIYFDLDKSYIRPDAEIELQKVIAVLKEYPTMNIDVRSHTDSRASDAYNLALSNRRNVSTINYIVEKGGIQRTRLSGRGYGEERPTNGCINGAKCSEAAHQLNRRSEFIIMN